MYVCRNDHDWTMEYVSQKCQNITGYAPEDFICNRKRSFNEIIHPDYQELLWAAWQYLLAKKLPFEKEYPIITAQGELRWVWERGHGVFADDGRLLFLEGFIMDITERKNMEMLLHQEKKFIDAVLDSIPGMLYVYDEQGHIVRWNKKHQEMTRLHS